ncbi:MAG: hypothetical protein IPN29_11105 [Saprospiraceae bacterium]|nr:hypothetical protein [Saprospiraceae bacterium]
MSIEIRKVETDKEKKQFIDFPHDLYKTDPNYVPEIYLAVSELISEKKNPFFKHSKASLYLAYKDDKIVGRVAAIINNNYNKFHTCNVGFFGLFDVIDDQEVANSLLDAAMAYGKANGVDRVLGPTNFTTNDTAGLLVEGFDSPPVVQMTYNYAYYQRLIEHYGFTKDMDMYAFWIPTKTANEKSLLLSERLKERLNSRGITFRNLNMKKFKTEVDKVRNIYRAAWEKNWGFVPPTDEEFDFLAEGLKMILDERYAYIAEENGEMIGFAVGLPDVNEIMINVKKGRLFPFGIFKLLFGKKKVKKVRIVLLGVKEEYRKIGIEAIFYANLIRAAQNNNLLGGEASWILESNQMMVQGAENLNGKKYKTYRIYTKNVAG